MDPGNLKRWGTMSHEDRFWSHVDKRSDSECWEWKLQKSKKNYGTTCHGKKRFRAHRMAWFLANGPIPEGMFVCHRCDNPPCCNPNHLFLGTNTDNMNDAISKGRFTGRFTFGRLPPTQKLNREQVLAIRSSGEHSLLAARRYGVARSTIIRIRNRTRWKKLG